MTTITTERLILRPFTETDLPEFMTIQQDPEVNRFLPWFMPKTETDALQMLHDQFIDDPDGEALAICLQADNKAIGYVHAEAAQALINQLSISDYPFLTATHDVNNPKSGAVMQRLGMQYQYTYLEQWQPKNIPVHFRLYLLNRDGNDQRQFLKYWQQYPTHTIEKF